EGDAVEPALEATNDAPKVIDSANAEGWSFRATTIDLGLDPKQRPIAARQAAAGSRDVDQGAPPSKSGGVGEALDAPDAARGLGRGGVVGVAVRDAVEASSVMGTAIFAVTIDAGGSVKVTLSSASQDEVGWARLNEAIRRRVLEQRGRLRMPPDG